MKHLSFLLPLTAVLTVSDPTPTSVGDWVVNAIFIAFVAAMWWVFRD